jgi:hypothetical protein
LLFLIRMPMTIRLLLSLLVLCLAGCLELPHTFEDAKLPPTAAILTLPDMAGIVVDPVSGAPAETGRAVAEMMASALQDAEILASTTAGNPESPHLSGEASATSLAGGLTTLRIRWTLRAADGHEIGTDLEQDQVPAADWATGTGVLLADAIRREAAKLAPLVQEPIRTVEKSARQVFVRPVEGAPGDGGKTLPRALVFLLKRAGIEVTSDATASAAMTVAGSVAVSPGNAGAEHVVIAWHVLKPDGSEAGQVKQENDIPKGSLDGNWGDIAMAVASSAVKDIVRVVSSVPPG